MRKKKYLENKMKNKSKINKISLNVRRHIVNASFESNKSSHIGGSLSMVEILSVLYGSILKYDLKNTNWDDRDRFILSKGHGALALFSILHEVGFINQKEFSTYQQNESEFISHPIMNTDYGIESSNGSLGHGLSMGVGISLAAKLKNKSFRTFILMGDGECNEGSVWEAAISAPYFRLNNLVAIVDRNKMQNDGQSKEIMDYSSFEGMWNSCGWEVVSIDGHDIEKLYFALKHDKNLEKPKVVIAETIKGKGISFMENVSSWHHGKLTKNLFEEAIQDLK